MYRLFLIGVTLSLCGLLTGCGGDSYEGLISDTISQIDLAANDVANIRDQVNKAVKKFDEGTAKKLDLSLAGKAAEQLKKTGVDAQIIKRRIEQVRTRVTDDERKTYAKNKRDELNE